MEKLELKYVAPYLPYKLKVQYYGIINGKELSEYNKKWNEDNHDLSIFDPDGTCFHPPKEIKGIKEGYLKVVEAWDSGATYLIGRKHHGLKKCYGYEGDFKPILRPLSDFATDTAIILMNKFHCDLDTIHEVWDLNNTSITLEEISLSTYNMFCKNHIDFNELIDKNLAIDINTL